MLNLEAAKQRLKHSLKESIFIDTRKERSETHKNIILVHSNFVHLKEELETREIEKITGIYYDL